jgi:hypothetical protein
MCGIADLKGDLKSYGVTFTIFASLYTSRLPIMLLPDAALQWVIDKVGTGPTSGEVSVSLLKMKTTPNWYLERR